jgi:hypothetical protein
MDDERSRRPAPTEDDVRRALLAFGDLLRRLEDQGRLLRSLPLVQGRLGDLRRMIFEYEVRVTERLLPSADPAERDARRIVREAQEREREAAEDWNGDWTPPEDPEAGG